jgi:hypothetical protein
MKKLVASVGLVALGVSSVQTVSAQSLASPDPSKPWSVSVTLRGFYDDNFNTIRDGAPLVRDGRRYSKDSFGFEVAPSARLLLDLDQTTIGLGYTYSYKHYDEDSFWDTRNYSQSHEFTAALDHAFSPRYRTSLRNSFVIGQEPDQLRAVDTFSTFQRVPGDNIRNHGSINFAADITRTMGMEIGYANSYFNYDDDNAIDIPFLWFAQPSLSGLLDRMTHMIHLDGRWIMRPATVGVLGYQFSLTDFTGDEVLGYSFGGVPIMSDARNNRSHYVYVGADHAFRPDVSGSIRVGGRYNDYYNDPFDKDGISPFVRGSLRWAFAQYSYIEGGLGYDRTATDLFGVSGGSFVRDQDAATIFGSIKHRIMPKLFGSLTAQFQNSMFNGGPFDGEMEQFYLAGLNLEYRFNRHFAAHVGYNYDLLESDVPGRDFDRNRVYLGVTAAY